jgi:hypothetical protein
MPDKATSYSSPPPFCEGDELKVADQLGVGLWPAPEAIGVVAIRDLKTVLVCAISKVIQLASKITPGLTVSA